MLMWSNLQHHTHTCMHGGERHNQSLAAAEQHDGTPPGRPQTHVYARKCRHSRPAGSGHALCRQRRAVRCGVVRLTCGRRP